MSIVYPDAGFELRRCAAAPVHRTRTEPPVSTNVCSVTLAAVVGGDVVGDGDGAARVLAVVGAGVVVAADGCVAVVEALPEGPADVEVTGVVGFPGELTDGAAVDGAAAPPGSAVVAGSPPTATSPPDAGGSVAGPAALGPTDPASVPSPDDAGPRRAISASIWLRDTVAAGRWVTFAPATWTASVASSIAMAVPPTQIAIMPARRRPAVAGAFGRVRGGIVSSGVGGTTSTVWSRRSASRLSER